ncbi:MAG: archease [Methanomicrobiaceae archaeon]|nr:archease [Methanomicrobiaceae archaeon]
MPFEELNHTADYLYRCSGSTIEELFTSAAMAMFSLMFDERDKGPVKIDIELESEDFETLLYDLLSELIFISEVERVVFSGIKIIIENHSLRAVATGERFSMDKHGGGTEIKGISRYGMDIEQKDGKYQVDVIFDV